MTEISKPTITPDDFWAQYRAWEVEATKVATGNKARLFAALAAAEITLVKVMFDGEGDSGQVEDVYAFKGDVQVEFPKTSVEITSLSYWNSEVQTREQPLSEAVETLAYDFLSATHGGWENNDGAYGEFLFDVENDTITLGFNERFTDSTHHAHAW